MIPFWKKTGKHSKPQSAQKLFSPKALRQHIDKENGPVRMLERLETHWEATGKGMSVSRSAVLDGPLHRVAGIRLAAPALCFRAQQAYAAHVAPSAVGKQLEGAARIHLHRILSLLKLKYVVYVIDNCASKPEACCSLQPTPSTL